MRNRQDADFNFDVEKRLARLVSDRVSMEVQKVVMGFFEEEDIDSPNLDRDLMVYDALGTFLRFAWRIESSPNEATFKIMGSLPERMLTVLTSKKELTKQDRRFLEEGLKLINRYFKDSSAG